MDSETRYSYTASTVARALSEFERAYGLDSEDFYVRYREGGELPAKLSHFERHVWASFVEDARRLEASSPIERVRGAFAHA
jgi:hypothetical protein